MYIEFLITINMIKKLTKYRTIIMTYESEVIVDYILMFTITQ